MRPIVNGLETEFTGKVTFLYVNAGDSANGTQAFRLLGLAGHPSYVLFRPGGTEVYRFVGIISADRLRSAIQQKLTTP